MFSSYFGGSKEGSNSSAAPSQPVVQQLHPPHERLSSPESTFGPLTAQDTSWLCAGGFTTETQTFYATTPGKDGKFFMCQVIHSAVGMWYPQINFTFRFFDPVSKKSEWRSTSVTNFVTPPPASSSGGPSYDKRSCKSDQFSILLDPASPDTYTIEGNYDKDTQVSIKFERVKGVPGWKLGSGPKGGMTYFGAEKAASGSKDSEGPDHASVTDGVVVHRFWPKCNVSGIVRIGNEVFSLEAGTNGIFIHAIQGMRPNLIAQKWNFGYFNGFNVSEVEGSEGKEDQSVSLVMMEFITPANYGTKSVNIGSVVVEDQLVAVISDGTATHLDTEPIDPETSYPAPGRIQYSWKNGSSLLTSFSKDKSDSTKVEAEIVLDVDDPSSAPAGGRGFKGLIEKVDVLAQIPYLVKKVIAYVAGTKPYIYTFYKDTTATITLPSQDGSAPRKLTVQGNIFTEATFISSS